VLLIEQSLQPGFSRSPTRQAALDDEHLNSLFSQQLADFEGGIRIHTDDIGDDRVINALQSIADFSSDQVLNVFAHGLL
jgi:hypothetical protein